MKLKYNHTSEREIPGLGIFKPNQIITKEDETEIQDYLDSGYFDKVKERKRKVKVKKSKKKGVDK